MEVIYEAICVVGYFLWSGWQTGRQAKILFVLNQIVIGFLDVWITFGIVNVPIDLCPAVLLQGCLFRWAFWK